jgi:uncharacterized protein CbrC (UPF0167 family)
VETTRTPSHGVPGTGITSWLTTARCRRELSGAGASRLGRLRADGDGPTGYLFRCLHCGRYDAFVATS